MQTITTTHPLPGRGPGTYTDSKNPAKDPAYPHQSNNLNPAGNPFEGRSFYDGPFRNEHNNVNTNWVAENMFCCRSGRKINVIGSFIWGYAIESDGNNMNGSATVAGISRTGWGPATPNSIAAVANEARGTKTQVGWTIDEGCCCAKHLVAPPFSDSFGFSMIPVFPGDPTMIIDEVVVFPRNRVIDTFDLPPAPGWFAQPWSEGDIAPVLSWQTEGTQMYQNGILLSPVVPQPGPQPIVLNVLVRGHESFFDVFVHDQASDHWFPWAVHTHELLGDLNGDLQHTEADLETWDLAFNDPAAYAAMYPMFNPIFRGDLSHDGALGLDDRRMLEADIALTLEADAEPPGTIQPCPADLNGDGAVAVNDLLLVIINWGACPAPCPPTCLADIDQNCTVGVGDLLAVISSWGNCP